MEELKGIKKVFHTILTVFLLAAIVSTLIGVWGSVACVSAYVKGTYYSTDIGFSFFIYEAWERTSNIAGMYPQDSAAPFFIWLNLVLSILSFVAAVGVIYFFGVRGIVSGIRGLITGKRSNITKNAVVTTLALYGYTILAKGFSMYIYGFNFSNLNFSSGWGSEFSGFFCWVAMVLLALFIAFDRFNGKQVAKSIRFIIVGVSIFLILSTLSNIGANAVNFVGAYEEYSIINMLYFAVVMDMSNEAIVFFTIVSIFGIAAFALSITVLVLQIRHYVFGKKYNPTLMSVMSGVAALFALLALVLYSPASKAYSSYAVDCDGLIGAFTTSIVTFVFTVSCAALSNDKNDEEEKVVDVQ